MHNAPLLEGNFRKNHFTCGMNGSLCALELFLNSIRVYYCILYNVQFNIYPQINKIMIIILIPRKRYPCYPSWYKLVSYNVTLFTG